ncbi:MAG: ABC transporter permease, partial [Candidatus Omnitrophica bacterium]|nr:ABC transporter permease [Candidatus Omnitrophota bacterium]
SEAEKNQESLNEMIQRGALFAYFEIGPNPVEGSEGCRYVSNNLTDRDLLNWFNGYASSIVKERRIAAKGIDAQTARWLNQSLNFETNKVGASGEGEKVRVEDTAGQWAPVAFVYILWVSIFSVAQILLSNTIEEKSNRIIEVLLSSLSPFQLMSGKILGNAATGLTVIASWIGCLLVGVTVIPRFFESAPSVQLDQVISEPLYLGSFLFYFLMGYFIYAAILVGIGSVCSNPKEAQNLMLPVMLMLIVPLMSMMPVAQDPNGTLARTLSYIPVFTPFVMMNRAAGPPPMVDYIGTTLLLLISLPIFFWGASRIFRIGILMTGQPPNLFQIFRWLFTETEHPKIKG